MNVQLNFQAAGGRTGNREWGLCARRSRTTQASWACDDSIPCVPLQNRELAAAEVTSCRQQYAQQHEARDTPR